MAALLIKLNFLLAKRQVGKSPWQIVGLVFGLIYALGFGVALLAGMAALDAAPLDVHRDVPILTFGTITVMWLVLSLMFFGVDQTLDPSRFSFLPLRAKELIPGLAVIGMLGFGSLACLIGTIGLVVGWFSSPLAALLALVGGVLGTTTAMLGARVLTTAFASALSSRRFKDLAAVLLFVIIMAFSIGMQLIGRGSATQTPEALLGYVHQGATILSWTPFGWAWALPGDAAAGAWGMVALRLVLSLVTIAVLLRAWAFFLDRALVSPLETGTGAAKVKAHSWVDRVFPATPAGAVAARTVRYWRRDSRHLIGLISILVMPFLFIVPGMLGSSSEGANNMPVDIIAFAPCFSAAFLGLSLMAELSYDGSAISTHMLAGIRGRDDRLGRAFGALLILVPVLLVMVVLGAAVSRHWEYLPAVVGLTLAMGGAGVGGGLLIDTYVNYPYPPPGSNPFAKGSGGGFMAFLGVIASWVIVGVVAAAPLAATIWGIVAHNELGLWLALGLGAVLGPLAGWGLMALSGRALDGRWPEVLKNVADGKA